MVHQPDRNAQLIGDARAAQARMDAKDKLPPLLRAFLNECPYPVSPQGLLDEWIKDGYDEETTLTKAKDWINKIIAESEDLRRNAKGPWAGNKPEGN